MASYNQYETIGAPCIQTKIRRNLGPIYYFRGPKILHDVYLIFDHPGETKETYAQFRHFFHDFVRPQLEGGYLRMKYQRFSFYPGNYIFNHVEDFERQYGFQTNCPQWWKQEGNHYLNSRDTTPSIDENGKLLTVHLFHI